MSEGRGSRDGQKVKSPVDQELLFDLDFFDPEDDGAGGEAVQFFYFCEGVFEFSEGAGVEEEDHFDEVSIGVISIDWGVGAGDTDFVFREKACNLGDDAWAVVDGKADVIGGFGLIDGDELAITAVGEEAAVRVGMAHRAGCFGKV